MGKHDGARHACLKGAAAGTVAGAAVCTENVIRFDCVTESLNVGDDDRAAMLPHHIVGLFVQKSKRRPEAENAALRHQLIVLQLVGFRR